jgi:cell division GTPase FtsZ
MVDAFQVLQDRITRARRAGAPPDVGAKAAEKALPSIAEAIDTLT